MAKKKAKSSLDTARALADIILHRVTGGAMGTPCATVTTESNFLEMRSLLETIIKIHALELKGAEDDEDEESAFDIIKRGAKDGGKKAKRGSFEATNQYAADAKRAETARDNPGGSEA